MAIRFKNGGTGQTAEGAILVANPDEFQDALNYQNSSASGENWKFIELEADLDLNYSVDWYYRMKDIFNVNALKNLTGSHYRRVVINGMGHSITNIYVYPNCAVFGTNNDATQGGDIYTCVLEINDVTFEAIIQKGGGFFSGRNRQDWPEKKSYRLALLPKTSGCVFNVKFDNSYEYRENYMYLFDYSEAAYFERDHYSRAVNCIFNIYISAAVNHRPLFKTTSGSPTDFSLMTIFESCEFRIRNNTDNLICIFGVVLGYNNYKFLIDNCAIFFADIKQYDDPTKRTSMFSKEGYAAPSSDVRHVLGRFQNNYGHVKALFYNSYIAAFGDDFNSGHNDPIYFYGNVTDTNQIIPATSFYDKSKIFINNTGSESAQTSGFSALTTTQCKDKTALSGIGYLFAEEV